jgi:hypothetical protein
LLGALYSPDAETVPTAGDKLQITAVFAVPVTEAASCKVRPETTEAVAGNTVTPTGEAFGFTVRVAEALLVLSAKLVAVI